MAEYGSIGIHVPDIGIGYNINDGLFEFPVPGRNDAFYIGIGFRIYQGLFTIPIAGRKDVSNIGIKDDASLRGYININDAAKLIAVQPIITPPPVTFNTFVYNIGVQAIGAWGYTERPLDTLGSIVGTVKVEGALRTGMLVRLYYKTNGILIASTKTDVNGRFRFDFLEIGKPLYTVLSFNLDESFNAVVMDGVSPVPTLSL